MERVIIRLLYIDHVKFEYKAPLQHRGSNDTNVISGNSNRCCAR